MFNKLFPSDLDEASLRWRVLAPFFVIMLALGTTATIGSLIVINDSLTRTADERLEAYQQQIYREIRKLETALLSKSKLLELTYLIDNHLAIGDKDARIIEPLLESTLRADNMRARFISPQSLKEFPDPTLSELFEQARASHKSRIRFTTDVGPEPALTVITPIIYHDEVVQYILLQAIVNTDYLEKISAPLGIRSAIFDINGKVLVVSAQGGKLHPLDDESLTQVLDGVHFYLTDDSFLSNRLQYSLIPLGTTDVLIVAIEMPMTDIENLIGTLFTRAALSVLAAMLIGAYIYYRLISQVTAPTQTILRATRAVSEGDLSYRIDAATAGEFADLADSFNAMMARLGELHDNRIKDEREIARIQEELRYKELLEQKNREIESVNLEMREHNRELSLLLQINQEMASTLELDGLIDRVLTSLSDLLDCSHAIVLLANTATETLDVSHTFGLDKSYLGDIKFKYNEGVSGETARNRSVIYIPDLTREDRYLAYKGKLPPGGSMLSLPLLSRNRLCGVLNLHKRTVAGFDEGAITFAQAIASQAAVSIENAQLYRQAREQSITDELTGLSNRRHFREILKREIVQAQRYASYVSVALIDIDHFKKFNDWHGHLHGDLVLKHVAKLLLQSTRGIDLVSRFGGEEFVVLLPKTDRKGALVAAEKLRETIYQEVFEGAADSQPGGRITLSIGTATYPEDTADTDLLIELADQALYRAKQNGRNCVVASHQSRQK